MRAKLPLDRAGEVALHHLGVIDVVLQLEVVRADLGDDVERGRRAIDEEAGNVAAVDRLQQRSSPASARRGAA